MDANILHTTQFGFYYYKFALSHPFVSTTNSLLLFAVTLTILLQSEWIPTTVDSAQTLLAFSTVTLLVRIRLL